MRARRKRQLTRIVEKIDHWVKQSKIEEPEMVKKILNAQKELKEVESALTKFEKPSTTF